MTEDTKATKAKTTKVEENDDTGPTCLYKGEEAKVFEGKEVAQALKSGWKDTPQSKG